MSKITKQIVDSHAPKPRKKDGKLGPALMWDTELRGFGVKACVGGKKVFVVQYQPGGRAGKSTRVTLGTHGEITCDQARRMAKDVLAKVANGGNPAEERRAKRIKKAGMTFAELLELYLTQNGKDNRSWPETRRLLEHDAGREWGSRPTDSLNTADVMRLIDKVRSRAPVTAKALFSALRPLFAWAAPRGFITGNPIAGVKSPPAPKARDRVLTDAEIVAFWACCEKLGWPFGPCFRLMLLTAQRETEVGGAEWIEFDAWRPMLVSELDKAMSIWVIPKERVKKDRDHLVDLSPQATAILNSLSRVSCANGRTFVFSTTGTTSISGWSRAKERLDAFMRAELGGELWAKFEAKGGVYDPKGEAPEEVLKNADKVARTLGFDTAELLAHHIMKPWRLHDLRRTAASGMAALGVPPHVTERVLNHLSGTRGGIVGVYQHHEYREERKDALLRWGARVEAIVSGAESNVVELARKQA